jgi:hypothetical protein
VQIERRCGKYKLGAFLLCVLVAFILCGSALAKDKPGSYPETGKVVGKGQNSHTKTNSVGGNGNVNVGSREFFSHSYKVETATRVLELDCQKHNMFKYKDCGGEDGMHIGDVIHLRIEKGWAYIALPDGKEDKQQVLNEEARAEVSGAAKPAEAAPAAQFAPAK